MKYHIHTLGCKFNQYESAKIDYDLKKKGHCAVAPEEADVIIVNSCAVTREATRKSFQAARHFKKINPRAKLVFTGCAVHDKGEFEDFELVVGNGEKTKILEFLEKEGKFVDPVYYLKDRLDYSIKSIPNHTRAFLSVENGCNWGCTYCAIPHFRGSVIRSKPIEIAVQEAKNMVKNGVKEIVITGINIALYNDKGMKLRELLASLINIEGNFRLRMGSIDPVNLLKISDLFESEKLCDHVHLSMQSGSDTVLRRMKRPYSSRDILKAVETLRKHNEFFSFSVDVIAGFPGESDEEFDQTYELLKKTEVSRIHVFPFSARPHTVAFSMNNQVEKNTKKKRVKVLKELGKEMAKLFSEKTKNVEKNVLVEKVENGMAEGFDEYYIKRSFKYEGKAGIFVKIGGKVVIP